MSRRGLMIFLAALLGLVTVTAGLLWRASQNVPEFYRASLELPGTVAEQQAQSDQLIRETMKLTDDLRFADEWAAEFTEAEINSWLVHELPNEFEDYSPDAIKNPRIRIRKDGIDIGFFYDGTEWSGVVSLVLRPSVAVDHRLRIEINSIQAGTLPLPADSIMERIIRDLKLDAGRFEWSRSERERDEILIDLSAESAQDGSLDVIDLDEGIIRAAGRGQALRSNR